MICLNVGFGKLRSQNTESIDLIDESQKIIVQVSATATKEKIESAIKTEIIKNYIGYQFKFISIAKDAGNLKGKSYETPHGISFNPLSDIYDIATILAHVKPLDIEKMKVIYQFIKNELGSEVDPINLDSNLAIIIDILSKEDWDMSNPIISIDPYEIERKISFNNLSADIKSIIDDYKIHYNRIDKKYSEFNSMGSNKSSSILSTIKKEYLKAKSTINDPSELFWLILDKIKDTIIQSANYKPMPIEELDLCINILVVDAFIRCKIFENPKDYQHVTS